MAFGGHVFQSYLEVLGKDHLLNLPLCVCVWPVCHHCSTKEVLYDYHEMQCFRVQCTSYIVDFNASFNKGEKKWALEHECLFFL